MLLLLCEQALRRSRPLTHHVIRRSRQYNGTRNAGPHTTYFQPPPQPPKPRRRILSSLLLGTTCIGLGAYAHSWLYELPFLGLGGGVLEGDEITPEQKVLEEAMEEAVHVLAARHAPPMDLDHAQEMLESRSGYSVTSATVAHTAQLPSNLPCEDTWTSASFALFNDPKKDWNVWAVFDGHAGPRTAQMLKEWLPGTLGETLWHENCLSRPYVPNDAYINQTIKRIFLQIDKDLTEHSSQHILEGKLSRSQVVAVAAAAFSGSCALLALYDPAKHVLRVANVGDSRAVLGRWNISQGKYVAQPMSVDQTGFNKDEVERIAREHPGEDVIDPKTGRVHGLAVSRAFGDARWKWPQDVSKRARDYFWGPNPRSDRMIKTPPYLTAEPDIMETQIRGSDHPDFLIMASDGLWDQVSSEDAVTCVQMWLDQNKPTNFLEKEKLGLRDALGLTGGTPNPLTKGPFTLPKAIPGYSTAADVAGDEEDVYYDEDEKTLKWRVSPRHFVVEDDNCGVHLIKNALGGKRRDLFTGAMSVQPPLSRNVRDDITVHVVFFGVDAQEAIKHP